MKKTKIGVYCIQNNINGKFYIGSSKNIYLRLANHKTLLKHNKHENAYLQNAWNKYGKEAFAFLIVEETEEFELEKIEQIWLDLTECYNREIGYNLRKVAYNKQKINTNLLSKEYIIRTPEYKIIKIKNLKFFAKENSLNYIALVNVAAGMYRECEKYHVQHANISLEKWIEKYKKYHPKKPLPFYIATNPEGKEIFITNLTHFCKTYKLTHQLMHKTAKGIINSHKGWKCRPITKTIKDMENISQKRKERARENQFIYSKNYICTNKDGKIFYIKNLKEFCKENNINYRSLLRMANLKTPTKHRSPKNLSNGWTCKHAD